MFLSGLFSPLSRAAFAPAGPSRAFSATATAQLMKTHKGAAKRFKKTASGLSQCGKQHLNTGFSASRINRLQKATYATKSQSKTLSRLLPYA
ncbi:50S ribosomal protein L35 [Vanrija pseudolonga]|uniref:Large ribosomal subunit protein bL35c n=1 Tax=Vanrija pseudolonga TaxID=143232 RepID=A0AAF1BJQ9_9TREE|nr:50S ribosomal protein L35 [Vanrija pseudolonga]